MGGTLSPGARPDADERSADTPRHLAALRRGVWLMVLIVVPLTATVLVLSLALPKTYEATASLVLEERDGLLEAPSAETSVRRLATIRRLLTSRPCWSRLPPSCQERRPTRSRTS